jgi:integrase
VARLVRLLVASDGTRLGALVVVATTTGLRRAELLGLRWSDVDLDRGVLPVEQTLLRVEGRLVFARPSRIRPTGGCRCRRARSPPSASTGCDRPRSGRRPAGDGRSTG